MPPSEGLRGILSLLFDPRSSWRSTPVFCAPPKTTSLQGVRNDTSDSTQSLPSAASAAVNAEKQPSPPDPSSPEYFSSLLEKPPRPTQEEKFLSGIAQVTPLSGGRPFRESLDARSHTAHSPPWPADRAPFHPEAASKLSAVPMTAGGQAEEIVPMDGYRDEPKFESNWEKVLAYHHGLYAPESFRRAKTPEDIKKDIADFAAKVHADTPDDACKYLVMEEQKCLASQHFKLDPQQAAHKCLKWFVEWQQCKWDQEKIDQGYNYIEGRRARKHRPFYTAPDYRYS